MDITGHSVRQEYSNNTNGKEHDTGGSGRETTVDGKYDVKKYAGEYRGWETEYKGK